MRDHNKFLCAAQDITVDAVSEHAWNFEAADKNMGNAPLYVHLLVTTTATTLTEGITIVIVDDSVVTLASPRALGIFTSTTCAVTGIIPPGDLTAGTHLIAMVPPGIKLQQFLGLNFNVASTAAGTLIVDAWVSNTAGEVDLQ
jgi:hypothetical protein